MPSIPPLAQAFAHHQPSLEARFAFLMLRVTVARTFHRKTAEVDLVLSAKGEDMWWLGEAKRRAFEWLVYLGFVVVYVGSDHHLRLRGYHGIRLQEPEGSEKQVAKAPPATAA